MTRTITLLIFGFSIIGCKHQNDKLSSTKNELDSLDYVVISYAIDQYIFHPKTLSHRFENTNDPSTEIDEHFKSEIIKILLIMDSTYLHLDTISQYVINSHSEIDTSDNTLINKIIEVNNRRFKIDNSKITSFKTQLISFNEITAFFDSTAYYGYVKLYEKYPTAYGIVDISKPAFNDNMDKAIIYLSLSKGPDSAKGDLLWLRKINDKWIVYDLVFLWIS